MKYEKAKNKIIINDLSEFNIHHILDCGQTFRYQINKDTAIVVSLDKFCKITTFSDRAEIETCDVDYFINYFDLNTNYNDIKNQLKGDKFLTNCCEFGYGIRLLKQDIYEMIISFIVSANNNINRIKNSLNFLSLKYGDKIEIKDPTLVKFLSDEKLRYTLVQKIDDKFYYCAFPNLSALKKLSVQDFVEAGLGYRAEQMFKTLQILSDEKLNEFLNLSLDEKRKFLLDLSGIGEKVMNCIMLFTGLDMASFPVDTWINKVYNHIMNTNIKNRKQICEILTNRYKNLSGYAQQYFFYYYRENKINV